MRIIVCDDCVEELNSITSLLKTCQYKDSYSIKSFSNPLDVLNHFEDGFETDVAFLDIMMPKLSGISLAKKLRNLDFNGHIVFLSSINDFAAQSYKVKAFSYLLKPIQKDEMQEIICEIEENYSMIDNSGFKIVWRGGGKFVLFSELIFVEVRNHHLFFHLSNGEILKIYSTMSEYKDILLADSRMVHNNRSFIFNMDYIIKCENRSVFLKDGTRISIPKNFHEFKCNYFSWMFGKDL